MKLLSTTVLLIVLIGVDAAVGESYLRKVRVSHSLIMAPGKTFSSVFFHFYNNPP